MVLKRGIREASVKDILESADVCRRTFYLHFKSKNDALDALYRQRGTDLLLASMKEAIASTDDPFGKVLAGVDAFLSFEKDGGLLLYRLQSEALNTESPLHAARAEVFDELVALVGGTVRENIGVAFDPTIFRMVFLGIEGLVIEEQRKGEFTAAKVVQIRKMIRAVLVGMFMNAPHLPKVEDTSSSV